MLPRLALLVASLLLTFFAKGLVPRHGRYAGPGHGRFDQPPLPNPMDVNSQRHDRDYAPESGIPHGLADRRLADSLRQSFRSDPFLGPTAQVYRVGEFVLFDTRARLAGY